MLLTSSSAGFCLSLNPHNYAIDEKANSRSQHENEIFYFWWLVESHVSGYVRPFAPKFWEVTGAYEWYFSFYECRFSAGNINSGWRHLNPTCCNQIHLNFLHSKVVGIQNDLSHTLSRPKSHLVKLSLLSFLFCQFFKSF